MTLQAYLQAHKNKTAARHWPALRMGLLASTAFAGVWLSSEAARAACTPAAANNVTATCTGTTTDQGPEANVGYGAAALTNLTVTVVPGATVTGTNSGVRFDTGTVFNSGAISGTNLFGIVATTATVTNSGAISGGAFGIRATTATVTNSGAISGGTDGINATTATVTNSGAISGGIFGIIAITATVTNSGAISGGSFGIVADTATVTNSGSISGGIDGINVNTANVTNSGTISGGNFGISATTANVTNSGAISGGAFGIVALTGTVTNSGTIIGNSGTAIQFIGGVSDTLNVLPGARFGGLVDFGGGADRVNFGAGSWVLNTANYNNALSTVTTSGNPYVVTANQIVVADLSGFGAMNRAMMDIAGWISSVLPDSPVFEPAPGGGASAFAAIDHATRFDAAFSSFPAGALGYGPVKAPAFKGGTVAYADGSSVWAKGFGGRREQQTEAGFIGSVTTGFGGALGYERSVSPDLRIGGFVGASANKTELKLNAGATETDAVFGGVYARRTFGASFLDLSLIGGWLDNESQRNIGGGLGVETARASYDGWFVNPALTLGHRIALNGGFTLTPALKLRYVGVRFDGYTETGSSANLTVGSRSFGALEERAELTLAHMRVLADASRIAWRASVGALAQQRSGDSTVNIALLGQNFVAATPDRKNVTGFFGGGGLDWQRGRVTLFAAGEATATNDSTTTYAGRGGVRVAF